MKQRDDKGTPEKDLYDKAIAFSNYFIAQNFSVISKIVPPLFGFVIFLSYFYQHKFYPSFDLFQFSSLLLSAFIIGFLVIGTLTAILSAPGFLVHYLFLDAKKIKEDITYALPYTKEKRGEAVLLLVGICYYLPFSASALAVAAILLNYTSLFKFAFFVVPAVIALCAGIALQTRFNLPKSSFFKYATASYLAMLLVNLLASGMILESSDFIESIESELVKTVIFFSIPMIISIIVSTCSMGYYAGLSFVLHFSVFFAVFLAAYSGILTTLPEKTMRSLGLGNYTAERIILSSEYCDAETKKIFLNDECTLHDVNVIWSFGEILTFTPANQDNLLIQIPSHFIKAIIKSTNKE